jgi:hypothetical protein
MILTEACLVLAAVVIAFTFPTVGSRWFEVCERAFSRLAQRRRLAVLLVGVAALAARAAVLPILPVPQPAVHDEFSYLLAADTFAHGRLANPPHPMWIHFETFHVIWHPSYASKYPPAQGLILAAGQVIGGHPFVGVWLSVGLMCAALCWMLQGWLPPSWALLGGIFAVIRLGAFSYWANSYWGGAVAAMGGALLAGALPRIKRSQRPGDALLMGLGLAILANSRPYEGLILSLPVAIALLIWMLGRERPPLRVLIRRVLLPLALAVIATAAATGYYCWRVTGNPFRMPYQVERATYAVAPNFIWQSPSPQPVYHHEALRAYYVDWEVPYYTGTRSFGGVLSATITKAFKLWFFFIGPLFTLPLLLAAATVRGNYVISWRQLSQKARFVLLASAVSLAAMGLEVSANPHYEAPITCLILTLILLSMRRLRIWRWRGKPAGLFVTRVIPLTCVAMMLLRATAASPAAAPLHLAVPPPWPMTWCSPTKPDYGRARILAELQRAAGRHLVIVRFGPNHVAGDEWVFNEADIDNSKVVWARDMGPAQNAELIKYFRGRQVWLVDADAAPPRLASYPW